MGKLEKALKLQLKQGNKKDAEDCLLIMNKLKEIDNGAVWSSKWNVLTHCEIRGFRKCNRYKPSSIGRNFLKGFKKSQNE